MQKEFNITYLHGDYIRSPIKGSYDLITMIYCDLGVLSHTERKSLLSKIYNVLSPTGCFLFDVFTPFEYKDQPQCKIWNYEEGGFGVQSLIFCYNSFTVTTMTIHFFASILL